MRGRKIAYKNIRKKLDQLRRLGLIELKKVRKAKLKYDYNEKPYQLSPSGLMTLLLLIDPHQSPAEFSMLLRDFDRIPVLKEMLPFFKPETIRYMTRDEALRAVPLAYELRSYVKDCLPIIYHFNTIPKKTDRVVDHFDLYLDAIARSFLLKLAAFLYEGPAAYLQEVREIRAVLEGDKKFVRALDSAIKDIHQLNATIVKIRR